MKRNRNGRFGKIKNLNNQSNNDNEIKMKRLLLFLTLSKLAANPYMDWAYDRPAGGPMPLWMIIIGFILLCFMFGGE